MRRATSSDLSLLIGLIERTTGWLKSKGTDQWQKPWPSRKARNRRIRKDIEAGKTWIAWAADRPAGTITIDLYGGQNSSLPKLWKESDDGPAFSAHRAVVDRDYAGIGLGAAMFNWAAERAAHYGREWTRIDVWTRNIALHDYYKRHNFEYIRDYDDKKYPSGALFQRHITKCPVVPGITLITDEQPVRPRWSLDPKLRQSLVAHHRLLRLVLNGEAHLADRPH
jgi:GNAT superfamily N-acetyltransferase